MHRVVLLISGGIAAYKACEVLRALQKADCDVRVAMTQDALHFVGKASFEALSGHEVVSSLYDNSFSAIPHISLADFAELCLVVPATANIIAKMAQGIADDVVSTTLLAMHCPLLVAPAMNTHMWEHPATQTNIQTLQARGVHIIVPEMGRLACGYSGTGKLASVDEISAACMMVLEGQKQDLKGKRLLITAGPTHEAIDPVRYLANASSGKMGYALAKQAQRRGAEVVLISGPVSLSVPAGVELISVVSAQEMFVEAQKAFASSDVAILAAAVADWTPVKVSDHKLKKATEPLDLIRLEQTPDILKTLSSERGQRIVVGFAAETDNLIEHAQHKLQHKGCNLIVANDVSRDDSRFGSDTNRVTLVDAHGSEALPTLEKHEVANRILDRVVSLLASKQREEH